MKINKKNVILGLEWLSFQCGEYMGDLQKDRCEISDIPQEYIDLFKDIDTGDSDPDEPLERFIDCPQCHKESGCYVRKNGFAECKHCGYYLNKDGKYVGTESCDICGKSGNVIEKKDSNSGNYYNICDSTECSTKEENDTDERTLSCGCCGKTLHIGNSIQYETKGYTPYCDDTDCTEGIKTYGTCLEECWWDDDSCDKCGGDGFIEYDNSSKKEGEVIESYDSEECNKCNGKGTI